MKIAQRENITRGIIVLFLIAGVSVISILNNKNESSKNKLSYDTLYLFNGENLDNWKIVLKDSLANPESTFFAEEGTIRTTGTPFGYIRTLDKYSEYQLSVEWRWTEDPGNSGVFLHIQNDSVWPVCLECQLMNQKAGDFVCFPGFDFAEHIDKEKWAVTKKEESSEKPAGEWNHYDIRVSGDSVSIYVNNVLQNIATRTNYTAGHIALQSEGAPLEFRNIFILKEVYENK